MRHFAEHKLRVDDTANIAVIFAIILFPLMLIVAAMIDTARQTSANHQIQAAIDAATISGALALQEKDSTNDDVKVAMLASFNSNHQRGRSGLSCTIPTIEMDRADGTVELSVDCQIPKIFGAVFSKTPNLRIEKSAFAERGAPTLDVALMLDVSDSMEDNNSLDSLKAAANTLIGDLITEDADGRVRIALVPYGVAVNAGVYGNRAQGKADTNDDDEDGEKVCVSHRENSESKNTDAAPTTSHYVGDAVDYFCEEPVIVPLTSDIQVLNKAIADLTAESRGTAGHLGLAWSWYTISSNWSTIWPEASQPRDNANKLSRKAIVMMTDGVFNRHYDSFGRSKYKYTNSAQDAMALCENILASGVSIYVVGLDVKNPTLSWVTEEWLAENGPDVVLSTCAGDSSRLFKPTADSELEPLYKQIAKTLEPEPLRLQQ
ncbi:MAG: TadE/TadG family type IV pilus assembly protein [Pseudomonadota bacterium]